MASQSSSKTEKATPERLRKAREQGQFLTSRVLVGGIQFLAFLLVIEQLVAGWRITIGLQLSAMLDRALHESIGLAEWTALIRGLCLAVFLPAVKAGAIILAAGLGTHLLLTRGGFSLHLLAPNFGRFNFVSKIRELPRQNLKSVLQAAVLIVALSYVLYSFMQQNASQLFRLPLESVEAGAADVASSVTALLWKAAGLFLVFGIVDVAQQYRRHTAQLRMSKEEIKEENKRTQGDPQMRARIRRLRRDLLRRQMMREVRKATAVIVNPTHFAVAIRYDMETMLCPVVTAKGRNWLALRIRQIAVENQVPIIENPPLARALYEAIDVGRTISPEFYKAIAEILAYVYKLMGRKLPI
ncbi:MAG: EscU/YscU/HrcU family type III secretion system export apparatus switch protein [Acidobacteriaceae bacterium]|nr:EscU/YscU/HrcU family type III secretion system export apparatus switch protein [Acidobacteriaceae bacterium]MBV9500147.1 EscU/YscU/HrcU family type III secretion system export apparatus switch protein [Acidobacteriaceae bacterium]